METWIGPADSWQRTWLVIVVLLVTTGIAFLRHGFESRRWRECLFLIQFAALGGVCGAAFDRLSFRIEPEFYLNEQHRYPTAALQEQVTRFGFQAGFAIAGSICALCLVLSHSSRRHGRRTLRWLMRRMLPIAVDAFALSVAAGAVAFFGRMESWTIVWSLHLGLYAGAAIGLVLVLMQLREGRPGPLSRSV